MRIASVDIGTNTLLMTIADFDANGSMHVLYDAHTIVRLGENLSHSGVISEAALQRAVECIRGYRSVCDELGADIRVGVATSAVRSASNGTQVLQVLRTEFKGMLQCISGSEEAELTFAGSVPDEGAYMVLDIGGGSLEIASGVDELPEATLSLPLGAARSTREFLGPDPYNLKSVKALQKHAAEVLKSSIPEVLRSHDANHFVGTSKTFRTLARICAHWYGDNPKFLERKSLETAVTKLIAMDNKSRNELPGVSANRAQQIVAGAIVALAVMDHLDVDEVEICPWALREGIVLRRLDWLKD